MNFNTLTPTTTPATSREAYLVWRAEWKANYKALSETIRKDKLAFKDAQRAYAKEPVSTNYQEVYRLQRALDSNRYLATTDLLALINAKAEANSNYLAERAAKEVA